MVEQNEETLFDMKCEILQPWSTFIMKTKLPPLIFEKLLKITDKISTERNPHEIEQKDSEHFKEFHYLEESLLKCENILEFFLNAIKSFAIQQTIQQNPFSKKMIMNDEWVVNLDDVWFINQRDNEYLPAHIHAKSLVSCVAYLKIPEYLPDRKPYPTQDKDGAITFISNTTKDPFWGASTLTLLPQLGDFYIFPAALSHFVYPFRTIDGKGVRRSVAFNAKFSSNNLGVWEKKLKEKASNPKENMVIKREISNSWSVVKSRGFFSDNKSKPSFNPRPFPTAPPFKKK